MVNLVFLGVFAYSLKQQPSMIERFARLRHKELPDKAIPYLNRVTQIWCLFFAVNAGIALYTATMTNMQIWSLYNGFISYLLSGALLGGEWVYRKVDG